MKYIRLLQLEQKYKTTSMKYKLSENKNLKRCKRISESFINRCFILLLESNNEEEQLK